MIDLARKFGNWISRILLGGRPMTYDGVGFFDAVAGRVVSYWRDRNGRRWMAFGSCSFDRMRVND